MSEQKTHAEIIAQMRDLSEEAKLSALPFIGSKSIGAILKESANQLEAAHKREIEATAAKCCQLGRLAGYGASEIKHQQEPVGNAAKLREVMKAIHRIAYDAKSDFDVFAGIEKINRISADALAEPLRNCEVGTAVEQAERFHAYCEAHKDNDAECLYCPLFGETGGHCELAWAQMPYNESEAGK